MNSLDITPTRAALLELKEERTVVDEAYEFLDEKRLLLAAEILRQLDMYERLLTQLESLERESSRLLTATIDRHGLQGSSVYSALQLLDTRLNIEEDNFMGVALTVTEFNCRIAKEKEQDTACNRSMEAEGCRKAFLELTRQSAVLAGISGNLHRLLSEYRLTERRARALENIILPEIEQTINFMDSHLEELDLEEVVRARLQYRH